MNGFSAAWLQLREPFDHAARQAAAAVLCPTERLARWRRRSTGQALTVIDLACGHGANLRVLAPELGGAQRWRLIDHDPALLDAVPDALAQWARLHRYRCVPEGGADAARALAITGPDFHVQVVCERVDLARDLASLDFGEAPLVTASALLDLVSAAWLQALVHKARAARAALLFGLSVDGRTVWNPADPDDELVQGLYAQHQRRDKGFGPALGPRAAVTALLQLTRAQYEALQTQSDWLIDGAQAPRMQLALIEGMATASLQQDPAAEAVLRSWQARRSAAIGSARLRVGHADIVATLA